MNRDTEVTKDTMLPTNNGSTEDVQPPVIQVQSQNPTSEPVVDSVDFLLLEEANAFIAVNDEPISREIDATYYDPEGDILILEALLNSEPLPPLPNHKDYSPEIREELKVVEAKSSFDEPPEFKVHKRAIAWKLSDIKGDDPEFLYSTKFLNEEDYTNQHFIGKTDAVDPFAPRFDDRYPRQKKEQGKSIPPTIHSRLRTLSHQNEFENKEITETFPLETLGSVSLRDDNVPWFADFSNYHAGNFIVKGMSSQQKNKFFKDVKHYFWDDPFYSRYVLNKSTDLGFYWPRPPRSTGMPTEFGQPMFDILSTSSKISQRDERCQQNLSKFAKTLTLWGIDFMGPFPSSRGTNNPRAAILIKMVEAETLTHQ
ncbi:hypothetical protein Tco_0675195 [Tanacetum coccineum]